VLISFETRDWFTNSEAGMGIEHPFVDHHNVVGAIFFGSKGYMIFPDYSSYFTYLGANRKPGPSASVEGNPFMDLEHFQNWIAAVRSRDNSKLNAEIEATHRDIESVIAAGADGVVVGALTPANEIDVPVLHGFLARAGGTPVTFHRAFDQVADPSRALETLIDAGVQRVLTAGGQGTALEGSAVLKSLVEQAGDRIVVLAGGKVRGHNARELIARTGVHELHARCETNASQIAEIVDVARSEG